MNICFCSSIYDMKEYENLSKVSKTYLSLADHNLNSNIIFGIEENTNELLKLINFTPLPSYPQFPKVFFKTQEWAHCANANDVHNGYINLPIIKQFSKAIVATINLFKFARKQKGEKLVVMTYDVHPYICIPILLLKKVYKNIETVIVVPDIPSVMIDIFPGGRFASLKRLFSTFKTWLEKKFDKYVLLTEQMAEILEIGNKPYVVVEGIYNKPLFDGETNKLSSEKNIVFYSGALREAYGIKNLVDAIASMNDDNYELWICGEGDLSSYIQDLSNKCSSIKYFGYVNSQKVKELQLQSTVLVNPRQNTGEYTKYSFPSKTMEYLASGKPVIAYKLDGIPTEYDNYIQYVENNSVEALQNKIMSICNLTQVQRDAIGNSSKEYVIEQKNPKVQCEKIVEMLIK